MRRPILIVVLAGPLLYLGDDLRARFNTAKVLDRRQIQPYYAIHKKNGKIEYDFSPDPESQVCVHSLFPHLGYSPCWYLDRSKTKRIDI